MIEILPDAIFLSDSHENIDKRAFLRLLKAFKSQKEPLPRQIFLLGDMFDFLTFTTYSKQFFSEYITLLNDLGKDCEIFYFEGNHDFNLAGILPNVRVFALNAQPALFSFKGLKVAIAHGDIFLSFKEMLALKILRIKPLLWVLNYIDTALNFKISKKILKFQNQKKLDYKISNFTNKMIPRLRKYNADVVIEGHYHQGISVQIEKIFYINLPCFACEQSFFMLECADFKLKVTKRSLNV